MTLLPATPWVWNTPAPAKPKLRWRVRKLLEAHPDYTNGYFMSAQTLDRAGAHRRSPRHVAEGIESARRTNNRHALSEMEAMLDELEPGVTPPNPGSAPKPSSKICAGPGALVGDNCQNMLPFSQLCRPYRFTGRSVVARANTARSPDRCGLLLAVVLACSSVALAQQGCAEPRRSQKPRPSLPPILCCHSQGKASRPGREPGAARRNSENPLPIPLPDVAARSQELGQMLRDCRGSCRRASNWTASRPRSLELEPELQTKREGSQHVALAALPIRWKCASRRTYWRGMQTYTAAWQQQLLTWANNAQAAIQKLDEQEPIWAATLEENQGEQGPRSGHCVDQRQSRRHPQAAHQAKDELAGGREPADQGRCRRSNRPTMCSIALAQARKQAHRTPARSRQPAVVEDRRATPGGRKSHYVSLGQTVAGFPSKRSSTKTLGASLHLRLADRLGGSCATACTT